ncbi:MAG: hypothetical protein AAF791_03940 [Bacteroidota bacterium]
MRHLAFALLPLLVSSCVSFENAMTTPGCDLLLLDINRGTLNGIAPTASMDEVKTQFPCSTGETPEGSDFNYGGGLFFINHDFYVYTHRDFIEVREDFAGTTFPETLGQPVASLGDPYRVESNRQARRLFQRDYGCLRVQADASGIVTEVEVHATSCDAL